MTFVSSDHSVNRLSVVAPESCRRNDNTVYAEDAIMDAWYQLAMSVKNSGAVVKAESLLMRELCRTQTEALDHRAHIKPTMWSEDSDAFKVVIVPEQWAHIQWGSSGKTQLAVFADLYHVDHIDFKDGDCYLYIPRNPDERQKRVSELKQENLDQDNIRERYNADFLLLNQYVERQNTNINLFTSSGQQAVTLATTMADLQLQLATEINRR